MRVLGMRIFAVRLLGALVLGLFLALPMAAQAQTAIKMCAPVPLPGVNVPPPCPWNKGNPGQNCHCGGFNGRVTMVMVPGRGGPPPYYPPPPPPYYPPAPAPYYPPPPPPPPRGMVKVCVPFPPAWGAKGPPPCPWYRGTGGMDCHCGPYPGKVGFLPASKMPGYGY